MLLDLSAGGNFVGLLKEKVFPSSPTENAEMELRFREDSAETQHACSAAYGAACGQS